MKQIFLISILILLLFFTGNGVFADGQSASLYFSPNSGTFIAGNTFDMSLFVNTGDNAINAVRVDLKYDPKKIQIVSPTGGKSFITVWLSQPVFSNTEGTASFMGGVPNPGINTSAGLVSTITFRAIAPGEAKIYFSDSSQVLLNDGRGTDILDSLGMVSYSLVIPPPEGPKVFSPTHPDQNKWYKNNNPAFGWEKEDGVTGFSYVINQDLAGIPDNLSDGDLNSVSYADLEDGLWYFHIKAQKGENWGPISRYIVQIDTTPPAEFTIDFEPKLKSQVYTSREPIISFITTDSVSGIDHYDLKGGEADSFIEVASPYKLSSLNPGEHEIMVRAYDAAGNWRDSSKNFQVVPLEKVFYVTKNGVNILIFFLPWWLLILLIILLLVILPIIFFAWLKKERSRKEETPQNN